MLPLVDLVKLVRQKALSDNLLARDTKPPVVLIPGFMVRGFGPRDVFGLLQFLAGVYCLPAFFVIYIVRNRVLGW